jgi:hypothetical protein
VRLLLPLLLAGCGFSYGDSVAPTERQRAAVHALTRGIAGVLAIRTSAENGYLMPQAAAAVSGLLFDPEAAPPAYSADIRPGCAQGTSDRWSYVNCPLTGTVFVTGDYVQYSFSSGSFLDNRISSSREIDGTVQSAHSVSTIDFALQLLTDPVCIQSGTAAIENSATRSAFKVEPTSTRQGTLFEFWGCDDYTVRNGS